MKTKLLVLIALILFGTNMWGKASFYQTTKKNKILQLSNLLPKEEDASSKLFKIVPNSTAMDVKKDIKNAVFLEINFDELSRIKKIKPSLLTLTIPTSANSDVSFNLHDAKILTNTFSVVTGKNEKVKYNPGLYYQGTVSDISPSLAGWSMFDNSIMAVFSYDKENWVLGLWNHPSNTLNNIYILYKDSDVQFAREFKCETDQLPSKIGGSGSGNSENLLSTNCIKIYFECDYQMFVDKGGVINVVNYVTGMFNVVQAIFNNESVNTEISEIYVWSATDPYISNATSSDYLNAFQATRTTFNGNLAHLLTTRTINAGGRAYLDVICYPSIAYGFSNISNTYNLYPTYSNTILIVTHELGHNFGSQHTHWCGWPGGPIDNCVSVDDGPCTAGPGPINGGTIMSYCHLSGAYPLSNGFGPLPGNHIRSRYAAAACLTACDSPPVANFIATPSNCSSPVTVTFTDQSFGALASWAWDVDNNGSADYTTQSPIHIYPTAGTYNVRLIVTNTNGSDTIIKTITLGYVAPSLSIAVTTGSDSICAGGSTLVLFTPSLTNGGTSPSYQWYLNGFLIPGEISSTFLSSTLVNNDAVSCEITSNAPCSSPTTALSPAVTMTVIPQVIPSATISISSGTSNICAGSSITFLVAAVNGGSSPVYQWQINGLNVGSNSSTFATSALVNNDLVSCLLTSNAHCASQVAYTSNIITMTVNPLASPGVTIVLTNGTNPTCDGVPVTLFASTMHGGPNTQYEWKKNGFNASTTVSYTPILPANGDVITCTITSNANCLITNTATSAGVTISVIPSTAPSVSVAVTSGTNPSCAGNSITLTATPFNSVSPSYQWFLNGNLITGAQNASYTPPSLSDGAVFYCYIISNSTCTETAVSAGTTVILTPAATINYISDIDVCGGNIAATVFLSNPAGAEYIWTNSNTAIGLAAYGIGNVPSFNAVNTSANALAANITVTPSINGCPGINSSYSITVNPTPLITQTGTSLTSSSASTYQWYCDGQLISGAVNQVYIVTQNGDYSVNTNGGDCPSAEITVFVSGIIKLNNDCFFTVYPNPSDGTFFVSFDIPEKNTYTLKVVNIAGALIYMEILKDFDGKYSKKMNLGYFGKGVYMLILTGPDSKIVKKIVIY